MKTKTTVWMMMGIAAGVWTLAARAEAAPAGEAAEKVGVYDSRAVAYAHFWSPAADAARREAMATPKAAKAAGDVAGFEQQSAALAAHQKRLHEQVFSTAPADDAMAALAPRLPALLQELGVVRLVSQWDGKTLKNLPEANRVDVTDRLVREFITPTEKQQKVLDSMKTTKPISLWRIKVLNLFGAA
jgi:hypothetical protein